MWKQNSQTALEMELYNCPTIDKREIGRIAHELDYIFSAILYSVATGYYMPSIYNLYNAYWRISKPVVKKGRRPL